MAEHQYVEAAKRLERLFRTTKADYELLRLDAEIAKHLSETAREALVRHQVEHGC